MTQVSRTALVERPARHLFRIVNDVRAYPRHFKWCTAAEVLSEQPGGMVARLSVRVAGFQAQFTTRNTWSEGERIELALVEGPFAALSGTWQFTPLGENGCKVGLELNFEVKRGLMGALLASGFSGLADRMVDDFVQVALREPVA